MKTTKNEAMVSGDVSDAASGTTTGAVVHKGPANLAKKKTPLKRFISKDKPKDELHNS